MRRFNQTGAESGRGDKNCQAGLLEASGGGEGWRQDCNDRDAGGRSFAGRGWPGSARQDSVRRKLPEMSRGAWRSAQDDEGEVPEDRDVRCGVLRQALRRFGGDSADEGEKRGHEVLQGQAVARPDGRGGRLY